MNHAIRSRLPLLFIFFVLLIGVAVMGYPVASNWLAEYTASVEIADYNAVVEQEDTSELEAMLEEAERYNEALSGRGDGTSVADYDDVLAMTDAIGYLEIPRLEVYMPIYHGVDEEVLQKGIGHLPESSLPVGGESTHCVLSGHTGLPAAKILTGLDQMEEGDQFYIHVLNQVLAYEVDQIKVVLPEETDDIQIVQGKDYVTLLTCTPYGINSHRLLVRGERTEYVPEKVSVQASYKAGKEEKLPVKTVVLYAGIAAGTVVVLIVLAILFVPGRRRR
jgi:sortase A